MKECKEGQKWITLNYECPYCGNDDNVGNFGREQVMECNVCKEKFTVDYYDVDFQEDLN